MVASDGRSRDRFPLHAAVHHRLAVICVVGVYIYLYRTSIGRRTRAVMQNREMAAALGVATRRVDA